MSTSTANLTKPSDSNPSMIKFTGPPSGEIDCLYFESKYMTNPQKKQPLISERKHLISFLQAFPEFDKFQLPRFYDNKNDKKQYYRIVC